MKRVPKASIFMAPMEGVTDGTYRKTVHQCFGGWDFYFCDFLRIPSHGVFKPTKIRLHVGSDYFENHSTKQRTGIQILASAKSNIEPHLELLDEMGVDWLDLNLGCPSKKVNGHKGGAYLLEDIEAMKGLVARIRRNWKPIFTCKIRLGYKDTRNFENIILSLQDLGVEAITIHGRTKEQLYKGIADWSYIKKAVEILDIPVIGNGDVWMPNDIKKILNQTGCHGVMVARGALKTPWLASIFKNYRSQIDEVSEDKDFLFNLREKNVKSYFRSLNDSYSNLPEGTRLRRFKGLSRYPFDDFPENLKGTLLRTMEFEKFYKKIQSL